MQKIKIKNAKSQITLIMVSFSLIVTVMIAAYGISLTNAYQRNITVQSAEFNLQLVANLIEQDLRDLTYLGKWCSSGSNIAAEYLIYGNSIDKMLGIRAYIQVFDEMKNNRAGLYVRRLIIVNNYLDKILQIDNYASLSHPLNIYSINAMGWLGDNITTEWESIMSDPLYLRKGTDVIPLICPVYHPENLSRIGTVFLAANTSLITDKLNGYILPENSSLYLSVGDKHYLIDSNSFVPDDFEYEILNQGTAPAISDKTHIFTARRPDGDTFTMVTYPIRNGLLLTQALSQQQYYPQGDKWIWLLVALVSLIVFMALIVIYYLDHTISRPITKLRRKIEVIANGDFSPEPGLEFDNELGQVGRGINRLSHDVAALMESRILDERQKRDLEYRMLQNQINSHFLYNTLNSIRWMATLQGADGIAEMTTALSRLLKTIAKDIRKVVTLEDELSLLDNYLIIQKYRYSDNLTMTTVIDDPKLLNTPIPRFSLQPLVENAIFHGIEPKGSGNIRISATLSDNMVLVTVTDDGVGMSEDLLYKVFNDKKDDSSGMFSKLGLHSVDERLCYAFGEGYGLSARSIEGEYTEMTLRLPFHARKEVNDS